MNKVKIFLENNLLALEKKINKFLEETNCIVINCSISE